MSTSKNDDGDALMVGAELRFEVINNLIELEDDDLLDFCDGFFAEAENYEAYVSGEVLNEYETKALSTLFGDGEIFYKAARALTIDHCCLEAILLLSKLEDDEDLIDYFEECYRNIDINCKHTRHSDNNISIFVNMYIDMLVGVRDFAKALAIQEEMMNRYSYFIGFTFNRYITLLAAVKDFTKLINFYEQHPRFFRNIPTCLQMMQILISNGYEFEARDLLDNYYDLLRANDANATHAQEILASVPLLSQWIIDNARDRDTLA